MEWYAISISLNEKCLSHKYNQIQQFLTFDIWKQQSKIYHIAQNKLRIQNTGMKGKLFYNSNRASTINSTQVDKRVVVWLLAVQTNWHQNTWQQKHITITLRVCIHIYISLTRVRVAETTKELNVKQNKLTDCKTKTNWYFCHAWPDVWLLSV